MNVNDFIPTKLMIQVPKTKITVMRLNMIVESFVIMKKLLKKRILMV